VPRVRERLVRLRANPHGQHDLAVSARVLEAVPLRRERAVWRHAHGRLGDVERHPPDALAARVLGVPDEQHLERRDLDAVPGEGEHLVPLRGRLPLGTPRRASVVTDAHLDVGARGREPARLEDAHVQVIHRLHEVVGARKPLPRAEAAEPPDLGPVWARASTAGDRPLLPGL
jgi:hypothetical protein